MGPIFGRVIILLILMTPPTIFVAVRRGAWWRAATRFLMVPLVGFLGFACLVADLFGLAYLFVGSVVAVICGCAETSLRRFFVATGAALVLPALWEVQSASFYHGIREDLKMKIPFVSIAERLPNPIDPLAAGAKPRFDEEILERTESKVEVELDRSAQYDGRLAQLKELHDKQLSRFVSAEGFGSMRMPNPSIYTIKSRRSETAPQARPEPPPAWSPGEPGPRHQPTKEVAAVIEKLHGEGIVDFASVDDFGYFKSREAVSGFLPHRLSKLPVQIEPSPIAVARVYLVGLVVHKEPVVYLTDKLPTMEKVTQMPTREPDAFEKSGIEALRAGKELHWRGGDRLTRVLGAIRATRQCVVCHSCPRGQLLGAFSYYLVPSSKAAAESVSKTAP